MGWLSPEEFISQTFKARQRKRSVSEHTLGGRDHLFFFRLQRSDRDKCLPWLPVSARSLITLRR